MDLIIESKLLFLRSYARGLLNLILNAILIPTIGIMGGAIATALTMALWNVWLHQLVVKHLGVQPSIISTFGLME